MLDRYRRAALTFEELNAGPLTALDVAIPELSVNRAPFGVLSACANPP